MVKTPKRGKKSAGRVGVRANPKSAGRVDGKRNAKGKDTGKVNTSTRPLTKKTNQLKSKVLAGAARDSKQPLQNESSGVNRKFAGAASEGNRKFAGAASEGNRKFAGAASEGNRKFAGAASGGNRKFSGAASGANQRFAGAASGGSRKFAGAATGGNRKFSGASSGANQKFSGVASGVNRTSLAAVSGIKRAFSVTTSQKETDTATGDLSKSKQRKISKKEKLMDLQEHYPFKICLNRLYAALLSSIKSSSKEAIGKICAKIINVVHTGPRDMTVTDTDAISDTIANDSKFVLALSEQVKEMTSKAFVSRNLQMCLKFGTEDQRNVLLASCIDNFLILSQDKHSSKMIIKVILYGGKKFIDRIVVKLSSRHGLDLFFSKYGAAVWEYAYNSKTTSNAQKRNLRHSMMIPKLIRVQYPTWADVPFTEFISKLSSEHRRALIDHNEKILQRCIDKELLDKTVVHSFLKAFISLLDDTQLPEWMDRICEGITPLLTTKEGVEVVTRLCGYATAKHRKKFTKAIKPTIVDFANNQIDHIFVIRLLLTVDDTRLLNENIVKPLMKNIARLVDDKYGRRVARIILVSSDLTTKEFTTYEIELLRFPSPTSAKLADQRQSEIQAAAMSLLKSDNSINITSIIEKLSTAKP